VVFGLQRKLPAMRLEQNAMDNVKKPFAFCCNGQPEICDCANPDHGTALYHAICIIPNCRKRAPASEAFCKTHRDARQALTEWSQL